MKAGTSIGEELNDSLSDKLKTELEEALAATYRVGEYAISS